MVAVAMFFPEILFMWAGLRYLVNLISKARLPVLALGLELMAGYYTISKYQHLH
jgi:hypothetical protein